MSMRYTNVTITGISPLLQNNPQTVDRFNKYAKAMKAINDKKTRRTDDDYLELANIEVRSKLFWDDELGIYVPATWVTEAIACNAFKVAKISKDDIRGALFAGSDKAKLGYRDMNLVKGVEDIVRQDRFRHTMAIPQGKVRISKSFPIYHEWNFSLDLEFDDAILDVDSLERILNRAAKYGGFGDFRPTFGRATVEFRHE